MNEIFNPSLLISLGSSARKALDFSKKQLSYLPKHFSDLVAYYEVESLDKFSEDIQQIVDTKLLSAKYLNKLVDLGYKVRSENISAVKINIYLFWDVYDTNISYEEVLRALWSLHYSNVDSEQHTGAAIYIISILEKEWMLEESMNAEALKSLKQVVDYISQKDNMLSIDSKLYVLHSVSSDGTRIPKEELTYTCAMLVYLNILPSKDPPLSHFNRRLIMHEGSYKVGTIGVTSVTVFKDRLHTEFSNYLVRDVVRHACEYEVNLDYGSFRVFDLINYKNQQKDLRWNLEGTENEVYNLAENKWFCISLEKDRTSYSNSIKEWQEYVERQYLPDVKLNIDQNLVLNNGEIIKNIDRDLQEITFKYSLKEGLKYLYRLEAKITEQKPNIKALSSRKAQDLGVELQQSINKYPDLTAYAVKMAILAAFIFYSMVNLMFPLLSSAGKIVFSITFFVVALAASGVYYQKKRDDLHSTIERYKEDIISKGDFIVNSYVERKILQGYEELFKHISNKREILTKCINNLRRTVENLEPVQDEDEFMGNLVTDLLDSRDRRRFYEERAPRASEVYSRFARELNHYSELERETAANCLIQFSREVSAPCIDLDFCDFVRFKSKKAVQEEVRRWIERGAVKSKYLLQYANSDTLEEHSFFMTSPEVFKISKEVISSKLGNFQVSVVEGEGILTNSISMVRLCLGIDLNNLASARRRREDSA
jgi:hypothetical protein